MSEPTDELDFTLELTSEGLSEAEEDVLYAVADERLRSLANGHTDLIGAAISMKQPAHKQGPPIHEATVAAYIRPSNLAATEKADNPMTALKGALDGIERQIRKKRDRLKKNWERPGNDPVSREIEELDAADSV